MRRRLRPGLLAVALCFCFGGTLARAAPDAGTPEILSIASLRTWTGNPHERVYVRGVVTRTGVDTYLQDATGGVLVHLAEPVRIRVGDELEVGGLPHPLRYSARLDDATARVLWATTPPPPIDITADQAARGDFDALFVEIEARLDAVEVPPTGPLRLMLSTDQQSFVAMLPRSGDDLGTGKWEQQSMVRVRGICLMDPAMTRDVVPFVVLLRSAVDAEQLAGPPWWSPPLLLRDALGLLCASLLAALVVLRVRSARIRAVQREREHIAHEMHDTLAQSFAGVAFQLQAVRSAVPPDARTLTRNVDLAINMVRHSHQEARHTITTLKNPAPGRLAWEIELLASLRRMVEQGPVQITLDTEGSAPALPLRLANALLRIGQEAGANAIAHAHAGIIAVRLHYERTLVLLEIQDDGCGFDQARVSPTGLGLPGMAARARALHGTVEIHSVCGQGTLVRTRLPLRRHRFWTPPFKR